MINFVLHPSSWGRASRIQMLSRLIGYMKTHGMADTNKAVASWILSRTASRPDPSKVQETPTGHSETWDPRTHVSARRNR